MRKINVIGTSASGKSTFGRKLAAALDVEYIEMDALMWGPNWTVTPDDLFFPKVEAALAGKDGWVLDGNYTRTIPIKCKEVDTVVWIDLPFWLNLKQSVQRALRRIWTQQEMWPGTGNVEQWGRLFSRDSIVLWMVRVYWRNRKRNAGLLTAEEYAHIDFVRLRSHREMTAFLQDLGVQR